MRKNNFLTISSILLCIALGAGNLIHLLFTFWVTAEQIDTGWGYGTNMEMAVLYPWMVELLFVPVMFATVVILLASWVKKFKFPAVMVSAALLGVLAVQYFITNLFIFF